MPITPMFMGRTDIFGVSYSVRTQPNRVRVQYDSFPGVNGRSAQALGTDGWTSVAELLLFTATLDDLNALEFAWQYYQQLGPIGLGVLRDSFGNLWPHAYVLQVEPLEEIQPTNGGYSRKIRITFDHLV